MGVRLALEDFCASPVHLHSQGLVSTSFGERALQIKPPPGWLLRLLLEPTFKGSLSPPVQSLNKHLIPTVSKAPGEEMLGSREKLRPWACRRLVPWGKMHMAMTGDE